MRVAMIGTGYVGLVSGACFADFGHEVTCIDKDAAKIEALRRGVMPIYEPGLDGLVAANVREGRLFFATEAAEAVREADAVFIAVGTPVAPRRRPRRPQLRLRRRRGDRRPAGRASPWW
jgi:UDPglucose 6-dehydrogenase